MYSNRLYFKPECPVCGRGMRVPIELLGEQIACGHCTAVVPACGDGANAIPKSLSFSPLGFDSVATKQPSMEKVPRSPSPARIGGTRLA